MQPPPFFRCQVATLTPRPLVGRVAPCTSARRPYIPCVLSCVCLHMSLCRAVFPIKKKKKKKKKKKNNSSVPNQQKKAIASSEFLRAVRLSSDADTLKRSEEKVTNIVKFNNFPESVIVSARERAMRPRRGRVQNEYRVTLNLPFHTEYIHNKIHKLLRKYKINAQLIYRNRRLSSMICTSALRKPPCRRYVDPSKPRKRGRPKAACVACMSGSEACTERNVVYHLV